MKGRSPEAKHTHSHTHTHTHTRSANFVVDQLVSPVTDGGVVFHVVDVVDEFLPAASTLVYDCTPVVHPVDTRNATRESCRSHQCRVPFITETLGSQGKTEYKTGTILAKSLFLSHFPVNNIG